VVAPLLEALLLRAVRRRGVATPTPRPTRLVSEPRVVDSVAYVVDRTSALILRPGAGLQVLASGSLVLPTLLGRGATTYVVLSHDPVELWLRVGPFETLDQRVVQQVELQLTVALSDSPSSLRDLAEQAGVTGPDGLGVVGPTLLDRLTRELSARTTETVGRRTLAELTGLSLGVLLQGALPTTFLGGLVARTDLEVVDVDWPTEGRGWPAARLPNGTPTPATPAPSGPASSVPAPLTTAPLTPAPADAGTSGVEPRSTPR
jgi:hypothetical protein